jgi:hypothetical protein
LLSRCFVYKAAFGGNELGGVARADDVTTRAPRRVRVEKSVVVGGKELSFVLLFGVMRVVSRAFWGLNGPNDLLFKVGGDRSLVLVYRRETL